MSAAPIALLAGATGAVGGRVLERLLARDDGTRVLSVGRRAPAVEHPRLRHLNATLADMPAVLQAQRCSEAFCCLGTTRRQAGSRAAFRAVDLEGVTRFARAARATGARWFGLVSSAGADPQSLNFYLRTKGEAEASVEALGFPSLVIMQPGLLRGVRNEFRPGEWLAALAAPVVDRLLVGGLRRYRSVPVTAVAAALDATARRQEPGIRRLNSTDILALAHAR